MSRDNNSTPICDKDHDHDYRMKQLDVKLELGKVRLNNWKQIIITSVVVMSPFGAALLMESKDAIIRTLRTDEQAGELLLYVTFIVALGSGVFYSFTSKWGRRMITRLLGNLKMFNTDKKEKIPTEAQED